MSIARNIVFQDHHQHFSHNLPIFQPQAPITFSRTNGVLQTEVKMSSREVYQVPTQTPSRDNYGAEVATPSINYLCGDCNAKVPLKRGDPIRCKECGHRVLYKERTKR